MKKVNAEQEISIRCLRWRNGKKVLVVGLEDETSFKRAIDKGLLVPKRSRASPHHSFVRVTSWTRFDKFCYKCWEANPRFFANRCRNHRVCGKCSADHSHDTRVCKNDSKCVNCLKYNKRLPPVATALDSNHEAWSERCKCPATVRMRESTKRVGLSLRQQYPPPKASVVSPGQTGEKDSCLVKPAPNKRTHIAGTKDRGASRAGNKKRQPRQARNPGKESSAAGSKEQRAPQASEVPSAGTPSLPRRHGPLDIYFGSRKRRRTSESDTETRQRDCGSEWSDED